MSPREWMPVECKEKSAMPGLSRQAVAACLGVVLGVVLMHKHVGIPGSPSNLILWYSHTPILSHSRTFMLSYSQTVILPF